MGNSEKRAKYVDIRYHFVKHLVDEKEIELSYCPTADMVADVMTKPLTQARFEELRDRLKGRSQPRRINACVKEAILAQ